jgi:hypothetical protein
MSEHIEFPCIEVKQGTRTRLYVGALRFETILPLFTVTPRTARTDDPYYSDTPEPQSRYPQRKEDEDRLREIAKFVEQRLLDDTSSRKEAIFPSTVILGLLADCEVHERVPENAAPVSAHLINGHNGAGQKIVLLPKTDSSLFVIDGQHRLKGLRSLYHRLQADLKSLSAKQSSEDDKRISHIQKLANAVSGFEVPITLLLDFDLEEQAMIFATVNFKQKPVQRSFFYDIFGAFESDKVTPLSFIHEFVVHLNNAEKSPLRDMIKLLGTGPGLVSQAFMVERLVPLVDPQNPKSVFRMFFNQRHKGELDASRQFAGIVRNFFEAVRDEFPYAWPQRNSRGNYNAYSYDFILCKSMVISGLLAILREIYKVALIDFAKGKEVEVAKSEGFSQKFFAEFLKQIDIQGREKPGESIFARSGAWAIGGSSKIERLIFESLRRDVFRAYLAAIAKSDSEYNLTCARFHGSREASQLARGVSPENDRSFWITTESLWAQFQ